MSSSEGMCKPLICHVKATARDLDCATAAPILDKILHARHWLFMPPPGPLLQRKSPQSRACCTAPATRPAHQSQICQFFALHLLRPAAKCFQINSVLRGMSTARLVRLLSNRTSHALPFCTMKATEDVSSKYACTRWFTPTHMHRILQSTSKQAVTTQTLAMAVAFPFTTSVSQQLLRGEH
jgi:hypothetical protein